MLDIEIKRAQDVPGIYACFLKFSQFNESWINIIRQYGCRKYHSEDRTWEFPFYSLKDIIDRYRSLKIRIHYKPEPEAERDFIPVPDLGLKLELFPHQKVAVEYGINHPKYLLNDSMGVGKTGSVIATAVALKKLGLVRQCLIVCCISDLQYNWEKEIRQFTDESYFILGSRFRKNGNRYSGSVKDRIDDIKTHKEFFLITNKETLREDMFIRLLHNELKRSPTTIDMIAFDEFHKALSNPDSAAGKNTQKLDFVPYLIPMTGTPIRNKPEDAWAMLHLIGKENSTFGTFRSYYCNFGENHEVTGYRNLDALRIHLSQCSLRRTKEEVLPNLPEKMFKNVYVTMNERQEKIYNEIYNLILSEIDMIEENPNPLAQLIRLRQATGYTGILSSTIKESAKIDRIVEDTKEIVESGEKVLIYSNWEEITSEITRRLSKFYPVLEITGGTIKSGDHLEEVKRKFQTDKNYQILVGTTGKMGTGHTLTAASWVLFADEPWTMADKDQAIDRTHRPGQVNHVNIRTYLTVDTIDERVNDVVEGKGRLAEFLVDGKVKKNNRELTRFLLGLSKDY